MNIQLNIFQIVILSLFILSFFTQLFYYLYYFLSVGRWKSQVPVVSNLPVSVIICAKNEADNLKNFLPGVLEQEYSGGYEVVVVNDCSEDETAYVLEELQKQYPHLRISTIIKDQKFSHNKKLAQVIGIKAAANEILLFTDADCQPESSKWLEGMISHFNEKTDFVLGYGGYLKEKGLLNKYIRYDSMFIAMQYLGMAIRKEPYMGVGRNLAYRKSLFFSTKGFSSHSHLMSGDDDLFVNANASGRNTTVELRTGNHTRSVPAPDTGSWIKQKRRHLTTGKYYKPKDKIRLFIEPFSRMLLFSTLIISLLLHLFIPWILTVFGIRLVCQIIIFHLSAKKLNEYGIVFYSIIFDIFSPLIYFILYLSNLQGRRGSTTWK